MESDVSHRLSGGGAGLRSLLDAIEAQLEDARVPQAAAAPVLIACDEIVSNIINHGGGVAVQVLVRTRDGRVAVEIIDDGAPFDPTAAAAPDTDLALEDRKVGGLGIHLVREMMDRVDYERRDARNHLQFSKTFPRGSAS